MPDATVAIILGSDSDWPVMEACYQQLREVNVPVEVEIISAHRTPDRLRDYVQSAPDRGTRVFIAAAGMSAALPGAIAAHTTLPVIGVPMVSGTLQGLDSLLSVVQMPPGVPVATVAIGPPGAKNAALLACQILAVSDPVLTEVLKKIKRKQAESVDNTSQSLRERLRRE
jgi:phosphoribosylaminoimidazole carboxylase PurE protein